MDDLKQASDDIKLVEIDSPFSRSSADVLGASDITTIRKWARNIRTLADCFDDNRSIKCRMASILLFEITEKTSKKPNKGELQWKKTKT